MPIETTIIESENLTFHSASGALTFYEIMYEVKSFYDSDRPTKNVLWDLTEVTNIEITNEQVVEIANYRKRFSGQRSAGKTAIVAANDLYFGLARMFEMHSDLNLAPFDVMVFRNRDEADSWLEGN